MTGSRIKRADIETSQPIFSLSRDDISAQGLTSVGDVIQNITANGSTAQQHLQQRRQRRNPRQPAQPRLATAPWCWSTASAWVGGTGLGGAVDLNTIPTAAVERIEVLKDGASTIYGSDAIAGVVNVILRQNFEGAEANAYFGQFDKGDGTRQAYDFTIGTHRRPLLRDAGLRLRQGRAGHGRRPLTSPRSRSSPPATSFGSGTTPDGRFALCPGGFNVNTNTCTGGQTNFNGGAGTFTYDDGGTSAPRPFRSGQRHLQLRSGKLPADPAGASLGLR